MTKPSAEFTIKRNLPGYKQIATHLRERILSGEMPPGSKLPSIEELANRFGTTYHTMHSALTPLVKEGLLERHHGLGTFVRKPEAKLTCVGVYNVAASQDSRYAQAVHVALKEELAEIGVEMDVWIDSRPEVLLGKPWLPLLEAAQRREFQAVIMVGTNRHSQRWQQKLPVPTVFQGGDDLHNQVDFDLRQLAELSVCSLAEQGCRSVGLIFPYPAWLTNPDGTRHHTTEFFERFIDVAHDRGLVFKNEWVRVPAAEGSGGEKPQEQFGYEEFHQLWRQAERPDGLMVFPDSVARGVILGLQSQRVRVPEDLKLVLHKNESIELLCPLPATFVVSSERAMAKALIQQVQKQFRGEHCEPVGLPFQRMAHSGISQFGINQQTNQPTQEGSR